MAKFLIVKLLIVLFLCSAWNDIGADEIPSEIVEALKAGNSEHLAEFFNESIELVIFDSEEVYSKTQARLILENFFNKHKPSNFVLLHQGGKNNSQFAIGNLTTSYEIFRVYFLLKNGKDKNLIHELRIENEED
ncbi:MAG: DUF4783 domain-containing protein [Bacteroidia bacterium]|nr:MAG: DUF4783 domain-containing protein [Bacteroidia bacterium]PIE86464.1 MAG: DUF4783 domain-containing protein [Bacteroidia bacterium]